MQGDQFPWKTAGLGFLILGALSFLGCASFDPKQFTWSLSRGPSFFGGGPTISPDGNFVAYSSPRTGNGDIYRVNIDGTNSLRLTSSPDYDGDPAFSPDGRSIVFVRETEGQAEIWIMNSDGSAQRQLTSTTGAKGGPRFASNQEVVFWHVDPALKADLGPVPACEIGMIDIMTGIQTRITHNKIQDLFPDASPDGTYFSISRADQQIWLYDRITSKEKRLGMGGDGAFSPDSRQIAVVAGSFGSQIDIMNIDGTHRRTIYSKDPRVVPRALLPDEKEVLMTRVAHPAFLPDGKGVLFLEEPAGGGIGQVRLVNIEDLSVRTVVDTK